MYEQIYDALKIIRKEDNTVIMSGFIAIIAEKYNVKESEKFGLRSRNERGERLLDFCYQYNLIV